MSEGHEKLIKEMGEASKDSLFLKDINDCIVDFEGSDNERTEEVFDWQNINVIFLMLKDLDKKQNKRC